MVVAVSTIAISSDDHHSLLVRQACMLSLCPLKTGGWCPGRVLLPTFCLTACHLERGFGCERG